MYINNLASSTNVLALFEDGFRVWYQSFIPYMNVSNIVPIQIKPHIAFKYEGDFYGLLDELGIPKHHHYFAMLQNKLTHPGDYDGIVDTIYLPDMTFIDQLRSLYMSKKGMVV